MSAAATVIDPLAVQHASRAARRRAVLWTLVGRPLFRFTPYPLYGLRARLLRLFGGNVDLTAKVRPSARISHPWNLRLGRKAAVGDGCVIWNTAPVSIGDRSVISQYTLLATWDLDVSSAPAPREPRPITIGDDVWVATECFVAAGSVVPDGALVGARSVVRGELEPWFIASGDPARPRAPRPHPDANADAQREPAHA